MEVADVPKRPIVIKYALITSAALMVYFLILNVSGLMKYSGLRTVNYLLMAVGIYLACKEIQRKSSPAPVTYLGGLGMGFMIVLITSILFSAFIVIFSTLISPSMINAVWKNPFYNDNATANAMAMGAYVFSETLFLGIVLDLIVTQFFKWGTSPESEEE